MKSLLTILFVLTGTFGFSQTWEALNTGLPANIKVHSVVFTKQSNYQVGYAVGGDNYTSGVVIKTTDGGDTWSSMVTIASEELYSVSFPTNDTGYACSMEGKIYKTTNGGTSWQLNYTAPSGQSFAISFKDIDNGVLGTPASIRYTSSGGLVWQGGSGTSNTNSQDISWCEDNTYLAAGYNWINLTTNNGQNWTQLGNYASDLLLGTGSLGAKYMAACGDYGMIHISKDYGTNWSSVKKGDNLFHDVAYWDTNYIYVVGTPGLVYKSADGGETFTSDGSLGSGAVFCVFITPAFTIYATGSQGKIWRKQEVYPYPAIMVTPDSLQFDTIYKGDTQQKSLIVTNTGNQDLVVSDITSSLPEYSANPSSFTLTPGQNRTVDVTFAPLMEGSYPSTLTIFHNAPGQGNITVNLTGYATFPVGTAGNKTDYDLFNCFPNPFSETTNIELNLLMEQKVHFDLMDAAGTSLYTKFKVVPAGIQHFESDVLWPASVNLPEGIYFLRVISEKITGVSKIVKVR
jgi:photosystem II stability/assembly factor-like uncharacterized protein